MPERVGGEKMKEKLYELVKNMPKNEALKFIDTYKDDIKKRGMVKKPDKITTMKETVKKIMRKL